MTAAMGLVRRSVPGAGVQVKHKLLVAASLSATASADCVTCRRSYDGWRRALLLACAWLQTVPNLQEQGQQTCHHYNTAMLLQLILTLHCKACVKTTKHLSKLVAQRVILIMPKLIAMSCHTFTHYPVIPSGYTCLVGTRLVCDPAAFQRMGNAPATTRVYCLGPCMPVYSTGASIAHAHFALHHKSNVCSCHLSLHFAQLVVSLDLR